MADDLYIELLRYGRENLADGVTYEETVAYLCKLHPEVVENAQGFQKLFYQVFQPLIPGSSNFIFTMEGYFHLLEHEELKQARQSSQDAKWIAIAAITLSGLLAAISIVQSALY